MSNELLSCPFCGGDARTLRIGSWWCVACRTPFCCDVGKCDTEAEAIKAWNTREPMQNIEAYARIAVQEAERTCKRVAATGKLLDPYGVKSLNLKTRYICSECSEEIMPWFRYCEFCGAKVVEHERD